MNQIKQPLLSAIAVGLIITALVGCGSPTPPPVPTVVVPTLALPTIVVPTIVIPTIVVPTIAQPTSAPSATSAPSSTPTAPAASPTSEASAAGFDGEWEGKTIGDTFMTNDSPMNFRIENNEVTYVLVNFFVDSGVCDGLSGGIGASAENAPVQDKKINAQVKTDDSTITLTGAFTSPSAAEGTFRVQGKKDCGEFDVTSKWKATKTVEETSGEATETPEGVESESTETPEVEEGTPPAVPTSGESATSADAKEVMAFFDALNSKDVNAALALVGENIVLNNGTSPLIGKTNLETYLKGQLSKGVTYKVSNIDDFGSGALTFSLQTGSGATVDNNAALLMDGKILILTLR